MISEESSTLEPLREVKLDNKHRGELAELAFMRKAASLGFAVAKPWGESDRYDVIVRFEKVFWRVQVKSVWAKYPERQHYRIRTANSSELPYSAAEIDFLAAYIFAEDIWYIFPVSVIEKHKGVHVRPGSTRSRYEQFREAWKLMMPVSARLMAASQAAGTAMPPATASATAT